MSSVLEAGKEAVRHEREMGSLCDRTGAPLAEVRRLFAQEFSRLELGAKVRSYLAVLTASNVRVMLRRKDT
jgi:ribosomal protein L34E